MPTTGDNLGHYRIGAKLGEGGMGEVWRATDTKLNREVAVKLLPSAVAGDPLRLARFTREAQVLASLNHPNIAAIYGVEDRALVMELVEGPTLAEKIATGPLGFDEALPIARQMAEALAYAHDKGIVHRDLKPANVKLTPDGAVKILDFGLAKAMATESSTGAAGSDATTLDSATTLAGTVLGTAAYMAPEQARGQAVDRRADVWAYGVVLYELLTGERPFGGPTVSDTLAAVLKESPDLTRVPEPARSLVEACLEKDRRRRLQSIADGMLLLNVAAASTPIAPWRQRLVLAVAAIMILSTAAAAGLAWWLKPAPASQTASLGRFSYPLPSDQAFSRSGFRVVDIAPDGSKVVYLANGKLYLRSLDALDAQRISGTPIDLFAPIFSPDGRWVAYFSFNSRAVISLYKIPVTGGTPVTLCSLKGNPAGASWSDGRIVFGDDGNGFRGIESVPDSGGTPTVLATVQQGKVAANPQLVDGGRGLLFDISGVQSQAGSQIVAQKINQPSSRNTLVANGSDARVLSSGELVYLGGNALYGMPFDPVELAVAGNPAPLVRGVERASRSRSGQFAVANNGTLVFWPGSTSTTFATLTWVDQHGHETPIPAPPRQYENLSLSPDGKRIAVAIQNSQSTAANIWIWDTVRKTLSRLTFGSGIDARPKWSPDGRTVYYLRVTGDGSPPFKLFSKAADGTGAATLIAGHDGWLDAVTPDGKLAVTRTDSRPYGLDLVPLQSKSTPKPLLAPPGVAVANAAVSPDGHWLAYLSSESRLPEVYVRPFPGVNSGKWQISTVLGSNPFWSRDGKTLYFFGADSSRRQEMMAAAVRTSPSFSAATPRPLFSVTPYRSPGIAIARDGRFILEKPISGATGPESLTIVTNWVQNLPAQGSK